MYINNNYVMLDRKKKEGRKKQARSNKQDKANTAHPTYMYMYMCSTSILCKKELPIGLSKKGSLNWECVGSERACSLNSVIIRQV